MAEVLSPALGTRVLTAHWRAVLEVWEMAKAAGVLGGPEAAAKVIAEAVLTATDDKTRWAVICEGLVYGPYASSAAAIKAAEGGLVGYTPGAPASVTALIPAPKKRRK